MSVRVRFAPSPTGSLHMGGVRTALFNYLFAQKEKGKLVLRIEDTDRERHLEKSVQSLLQTLEQLGMSWDEGVYFENKKFVNRGNHGPYRQSERLSIYKKQAQKLLEEGKAYYCFLKEEEMAQYKKLSTPFLSPYRDQERSVSEKRISQGDKACIRFKIPNTKKSYIIKDLVRGDIQFPSDMAGGFQVLFEKFLVSKF